jgi:hypothetical protein
MSRSAVFAGLVVDEQDQPVRVVTVGDESFYVVEEDGFDRHVEAEAVDRQVLDHLREMIRGHESMITEGAMRMMGQEDIFTKAVIERSLRDLDGHLENLIQTGLPESARAYLGMLGFRVVINHHGEILRVEQPGAAPGEGDR